MALQSVKSPEVTIALPEKLTYFITDQARYKVAYGGRGSAKSVSAARALIARALQKRTRWLCAREYQRSIKESVHATIAAQIDTLGLGSMFDVQEKRILGPHGSEFVYAGLHDKSLDGLKSYYGMDGCWIEEGQSVSRRSLQIILPTIREDGSEIWITMNPENEDDPVYTDFILRPPSNAIVRKVNWYDNPWFNDILRDEKDKDYARDPDAAAWIWGGECLRNSNKQVLRGRYRVETFEPVPNLWDGPYHGVDWGFALDPTVMMRVWLWEGKLWVEYEAYGIGVEIDHTPALFDLIPGARGYVSRADSARPETISYCIRNGYGMMQSAYKWRGSVEDGVDYLRSFQEIVIHPRCRHTADEARLWSFKVNNAGDVLRDLEDKHNHCWDAIRYALQPHIQGQIKAAAQELKKEIDADCMYQGPSHSWMAY